jgi:hypothetical protein
MRIWSLDYPVLPKEVREERYQTRRRAPPRSAAEGNCLEQLQNPYENNWSKNLAPVVHLRYPVLEAAN